MTKVRRNQRGRTFGPPEANFEGRSILGVDFTRCRAEQASFSFRGARIGRGFEGVAAVVTSIFSAASIGGLTAGVASLCASYWWEPRTVAKYSSISSVVSLGSCVISLLYARKEGGYRGVAIGAMFGVLALAVGSLFYSAGFSLGGTTFNQAHAAVGEQFGRHTLSAANMIVGGLVAAMLSSFFVVVSFQSKAIVAAVCTDFLQELDLDEVVAKALVVCVMLLSAALALTTLFTAGADFVMALAGHAVSESWKNSKSAQFVSVVVVLVMLAWDVWCFLSRGPRNESVQSVTRWLLRFGASSFKGADLRKAVFDGAVLSHVVFDDASLAGTRWSGAVGLETCYFTGPLNDARVRAIVAARGAQAGAILDGIDFSEMCLDGFSMEGVSLSHARFDGSSCRGTRFSGSDLSFASFRRADLTEAELTGACLCGVSFVAVASLEDVVCERFYLGEPKSAFLEFSEVRPSAGTLSPGDFQLLHHRASRIVELVMNIRPSGGNSVVPLVAAALAGTDARLESVRRIPREDRDEHLIELKISVGDGQMSERGRLDVAKVVLEALTHPGGFRMEAGAVLQLGAGATNVSGNQVKNQVQFVGRDNITAGNDVVGGDRVGRDKVGGDLTGGNRASGGSFVGDSAGHDLTKSSAVPQTDGATEGAAKVDEVLEGVRSILAEVSRLNSVISDDRLRFATIERVLKEVDEVGRTASPDTFDKLIGLLVSGPLSAGFKNSAELFRAEWSRLFSVVSESLLSGGVRDLFRRVFGV